MRRGTYIDVLVYVGMFLTEKPDLPSAAAGQSRWKEHASG